MMDNDVYGAGAVIVKGRKGRSPAYPYIPLGKALERAEELRQQDGFYSVPPTSAYKAWGFGGKSSGARQTLAALKYFGLIDYVGHGNQREVKLTDLAKNILLDKEPDSPQRARLIKEAALNPAIHQDLRRKFPGNLPSNHTIETYLLRDRGFSDKAVKELINEFKATVDFSGLLQSAHLPDEIEHGSGSDGETEVEQPEIGDLVQWDSGGVLLLETAQRVRAVQETDGKSWVFVENSEAGIPMEQIVVEQKATKMNMDIGHNPPILPLAKNDDSLPSEREWLRGPLSKVTAYRLMVEGNMGPKEIGRLIKVLEAQKEILTEEDG